MIESSFVPRILGLLMTLALLIAVAYGGYRYGRGIAPIAPSASVDAPATKREVLYWYDPMKPDQHFDAPGRSPFMDMELVPRYRDENARTSAITVDARAAQNLGMRTVRAEMTILRETIEATGEFAFNQRDVAVIQTRAGGFVERVYGHAPGDLIARGAPIADLLVPSWASAQQEFLALLDLGDARLLPAARSRLRLLGLSENSIAEVERTRAAHPVVTIRAPIAGVIVGLEVRTGMTVTAGATLATVNGRDPAWLEVAIPERAAGRLAIGDPIDAQLPAYPAEPLHGRVTTLLPDANAQSRTVRLRAEFGNADGRLRPGMSARVTLRLADDAPVLRVPAAAIIRGGNRDVVMLAEGGGHYRPVVVQLGREADGQVEIRGGLAAGDRVVVSGQFLLDAEANLGGAMPAGDRVPEETP